MRLRFEIKIPPFGDTEKNVMIAAVTKWTNKKFVKYVSFSPVLPYCLYWGQIMSRAGVEISFCYMYM